MLGFAVPRGVRATVPHAPAASNWVIPAFRLCTWDGTSPALGQPVCQGSQVSVSRETERMQVHQKRPHLRVQRQTHACQSLLITAFHSEA